MNIPNVDFAIIGGSGTLSSNFPRNSPAIILADNLFFNTPYGSSPAFRLCQLDGKNFLTCKMHGWRTGVSRADSSRQIFWTFREAGVKKILSEGGVGSVNRLLNPRDLLVPDDYLDLSVRKNVQLDGRYILTFATVFDNILCAGSFSFISNNKNFSTERRLSVWNIHSDRRHIHSNTATRLQA